MKVEHQEDDNGYFVRNPTINENDNEESDDLDSEDDLAEFNTEKKEPEVKVEDTNGKE